MIAVIGSLISTLLAPQAATAAAAAPTLTLRIRKLIVDSDNNFVDDDFTDFAITPGRRNPTSIDPFTINAKPGAEKRIENLPMGVYTFTEEPTPGYHLNQLACFGANISATVDVDTGTFTMTADDPTINTTVTCTLVNEKEPTLTLRIRKLIVDSDNNFVDDDLTDFAITPDNTTNPAAIDPFTLNAIPNTEERIENLPMGVYTFTEEPTPGYHLNQLACFGANIAATVDVDTGTFTMAADDPTINTTVTCTLVNEKEPTLTLRIRKLIVDSDNNFVNDDLTDFAITPDKHHQPGRD